MSTSTPDTTFDPLLALSLVPTALRLADLTTLSSATPFNDPDARLAKIKVSKEATHFRQTLATLRTQAEAIPAGDLSLDDQDWLIEQLEAQLESRRAELAQLANRLPTTTSDTKMDTQ